MKTLYYSLLLVLFATCFPNFLLGQTTSSSPLKLPEIAPPAPEAAAFARYGTIPVNYATGVPNISIPVYTIKSGQLEFPLSFSYHASGNKVEDIASSVGLGWVFNGSGVITQVSMGGGIDTGAGGFGYKSSQEIQNAITAIEIAYPDPVSLERAHAFANLVDGGHLQAFVGNYADTQSDRFTFNFNGKSGVFRDDFVTGASKILIPYYPIKIDALGNGYKITDENGTSYVFDQREATSVSLTNNKTYSYYLSSITSLDGADTITFEYGNLDGYFSYSPNSSLSYGKEFNGYWQNIPGGSAFGPMWVETNEDKIYNNTQNSTRIVNSPLKYLTKVKSKNVIVELLYDSNPREDIGLKRLDEIKIYANNNGIVGNLIKKIKLDNNSYFQNSIGDNKRLKLNGVTFLGTNDNPGEKYSFEYDPTQLPRSFSNGIADYLNYGTSWPHTQTDLSGYYNGILNNFSYPNTITGINNIGNYSYAADRNPNESYAQASILTKIHFPTGGRTEFKYGYNFSSGFGGLNVKEITSYTKDDVVGFTKNYDYSGIAIGNNNWDSNSIYKYTMPHYYAYWLGGMLYDVKENEWTYIQDSPLYSFDSVMGHATYYTNVTETHGTANANIGKTEFEYQYPNILGIVPEGSQFLRLYDYDWGIIEPLLKEQKEYKNGSVLPVKVTNNTYQKVKEQVISTGIKIIKAMNDIKVNGDRTFFNLRPEKYVKSFIYKDSKAFSERYNLVNTTIVETLSNGDITSKNINYTYNDLLQLKDETETINGKTIQTSHKYVADCLSNPVNNSVYQSMYQDHLYTPLVESTVSVNGNQVSRQYNQYKDFATKMYKQELVQTQKSASDPLETRIQFNKYGNTGNPVEFLKTNDLVNSYIWGYQGQYPIAKIENASYESIAQALGTTVAGLKNYNETNLAAINALRTSLPYAMVTTYTFDPLIGVTSITDPKGDKITYEYDEFNRLKQVKDKDGHILSKNEYHYKNQ